MRSSSTEGVSSWAGYVKAARDSARLSQTTLAERMGISRNTISRWEIGRYKPDRAEDVIAFARATGVPVDEALAAAGFRPDVPAPAEPSAPADPEIDRIRRAPISDAAKKRLVEMIVKRRAREQQTRMAELELLIQAAERLDRP